MMTDRPDPHCHIGRVRLKGSDRWWIIPRVAGPLKKDPTLFLTTLEMGVRIVDPDAVIEVEVVP
jgi:hypothetical protein